MFAKKPHVDVKKSSLKALDTKKDSLYRIKHLRIYLDNVDISEAKNFFDYHYSHIYYIFFDTLSSLEGGFKQKGHKQVKEELDSVLFILEKILIFLPELIARRWQFHSLSIVLKKLLHPHNSIKVRQEGIRCFLLWFQISGHPVNHEVKAMFESLVPLNPCAIVEVNNVGHVVPIASQSPEVIQREGGALFYGQDGGAIQAIEIEPLIPRLPTDPLPKDIPCFFLQTLLDFMVSQVPKIVWKESRQTMQIKCFTFLFEQFKDSYIKNIFPDLDEDYNIYNGNFDLPSLRTSPDIEAITDPRMVFINRDVTCNAKSVVIRWFCKYLCKEPEAKPREMSPGQPPRLMHSINLMNPQAMMMDSPFGDTRPPTTFEYDLVRTIVCSGRSNVNLVHELLRQAFLLPLTQSFTMRHVIGVYKEWINSSTYNEGISFLDEPSNPDSESEVRIGLSKVLRAFITNASNVFLIQVPHDRPLILEEQVEMCKRVLNNYRFMVMKVEMDRETWEQLLLVLLRVTSLVLTSNVPIRKEEVLGGRLAPAFFQTIIVTWIRANINVSIPFTIWEEFQKTMIQLTGWEELIREWSKTMDTITRVMSRYLYNVNLHDLPLERSVGDKKDRRRPRAKPEVSPSKSVEVPPHQDSSTVDGNRLDRSSSSSQSRKISKRRNTLSRSASDSRVLVQNWRSKRKPKVDQKSPLSRQISKSLDLLARVRSPSPTDSDDSRSPSPTPSSNIDSASLKDSPMNLDGVSMSSNNSSTNAIRSVVAGGTHRGWTVDSSVILWRRMLGVLGDVNALLNPMIHAQVMECLAKTVDDLIKVKENIGIVENGSPPTPTNIVPPIGYFCPWFLKCLQLPDEFRKGKLIALRSLCVITLRRHEVPLSVDFMCHFFKVLTEALNSKDVDFINTVFKTCSTTIFSLGTPGSTIVLNPVVEACTYVITSDTRKDSEHRMPRNEAISILGTIVGLLTYFEQIQKQNQTLSSPDKPGKDLKDRVLSLILRGCRKELSTAGRSVALNCLALYLYQELSFRVNPIHNLSDIISCLLSTTQFHDRVLVRVACDALRVQTDHVVILLDNHPEVPRRIIQELCQSLTFHFQKRFPAESLKEFVLSIIMCLGEWIMAVPVDFLKSPPPTDPSCPSLLSIVTSTLNSILKPNESTENGSELEGDSTLTDIPRKNDTSSKETDFPLLAAKMLLAFMVNHLGHFPRSPLGSARINCMINEASESEMAESAKGEELSMDHFNSPSSLFFIVNNSSVVSFTELDSEKVRIITRDLTGRFAWDATQILPEKQEKNGRVKEAEKNIAERTSDEFEDSDHEVQSHKTDFLDTLYQYVSQTSPECMTLRKGRNSQSPLTMSNGPSAQAEENMIALLLNQHYQELSYVEKNSEGRDVHRRKLAAKNFPNGGHISIDPSCSLFSRARRLIDQLGFLTWERRCSVELLERNDKVLREIRNLDNQRCRETHKIAVIYVADGQEDKNSLLTNNSGSRAFESFVSGLGWEVDLEKHTGFMGGLQSNGSNGKSTPYFANSLLEVIFHVSTRIPAKVEDSESLTRKLRHLGNDEVHIVWSEHWRDYRRGIIPTEFGDVLIVIYPVWNTCDFFRIQIIRKPEVPFFGPLFDGSVVHASILPSLVRATAINASRAQRTNVAYYHHFFEERFKCIESIVRNKDKKSFEEFAATCFYPHHVSLRSRQLGHDLQERDPTPSPKPRSRPSSSGQVLSDSLISRTLSDSGTRERQHRPLSSTTTSPIFEA